MFQNSPLSVGTAAMPLDGDNFARNRGARAQPHEGIGRCRLTTSNFKVNVPEASTVEGPKALSVAGKGCWSLTIKMHLAELLETRLQGCARLSVGLGPHRVVNNC